MSQPSRKHFNSKLKLAMATLVQANNVNTHKADNYIKQGNSKLNKANDYNLFR